ncbi:DnaB-like helicase C-terminal domain-containing protein [Zobellia sp. B3R18]|uniref:DnaB-like helicase C-terminal domain-containing protein n=1 Tax=Zobellia sp. B3R18 TaxID=2841568 RepID=UPI001C07919C|nr:DnaB-like helicase C-terminal domain-containing protein [Zobellia sp. B3R18]MBU2974010.1 DnaB-like helicase C-terminal domain-containing protein [Zobellia sp. B3R18]
MILKDLVHLGITRIEANSMSDSLCGIPSGFEKLDRLTYGWQNSELITIGGRAGIGKTAFALSMARNIAVDCSIPIKLFTLESSSESIIFKLISLESKLSLKRIKSGKLENHEWAKMNVETRKLKEAPLYINDTPAISIEKLVSEIRYGYEEEGIRIVIIDYLQLIEIEDKNVKASNREQCVSIIVKKLKALSKELKIPILLISQLNRALEERSASKRPILYDLRDSGAIEDDSDIVGFIYRPEYYKIDEWDDEDRDPTQSQAEFIIAKNRNGGLGSIRLKFTEDIGEFDNLDDFESSFEFKSKMTDNEGNPFMSKNLRDDNQAFDSSMNDSSPLDDNDCPF